MKIKSFWIIFGCALSATLYTLSDDNWDHEFNWDSESVIGGYDTNEKPKMLSGTTTIQGYGIVWGENTDGFGVLSCATYYTYNPASNYKDQSYYNHITSYISCFYAPYNGTQDYGKGEICKKTPVLRWVELQDPSNPSRKMLSIPWNSQHTNGQYVSCTVSNCDAYNNEYEFSYTDRFTSHFSNKTHVNKVSYNTNKSCWTIELKKKAFIGCPNGNDIWLIYFWEYLQYDFVISSDIKTNGGTGANAWQVSQNKGDYAQFWTANRAASNDTSQLLATNKNGTTGTLLYLDGHVSLKFNGTTSLTCNSVPTFNTCSVQNIKKIN